MQIFVNIEALQRRLLFLKSKGKSIGFVPTMGALHDGHLELVKKSVEKSDITVCSIFVNPTQFNNKEDLLKYPNTIESDKNKLKKGNVDILFYPSEKTVYPKDLDLEVKINLEGLDEKWEGEFRPGHFKGVVQVVNRLLDLVQPDYLFMGQKDFQQYTIINMMLNKLRLKTQLVVVPIHRESDGLAMSSRNVRLTNEFRAKSIVLFEALNFAKNNYFDKSILEIEEKATNLILKAGLKPEYFKLINGNNLNHLDSKNTNYVVAIVAAWAGEIRLIDNIIIKSDNTK